MTSYRVKVEEVKIVSRPIFSSLCSHSFLKVFPWEQYARWSGTISIKLITLIKFLFVGYSCYISHYLPPFYFSHLSPFSGIISVFPGRQENWWTLLPGVRNSKAHSGANSVVLTHKENLTQATPLLLIPVLQLVDGILM